MATMRIGILGTRGIPNRYGGFEEFAEQVAKLWAYKDHEVYVYCEDVNEKSILALKGIIQVYIKSSSGFFGQILYDFRCTRHALELNLDIIYHAGYATSVLGNIILKKRLGKKLIYNLDGLEWKRSKFNFITRFIIKKLESIAVNSGATLVADNIGIKNYIKEEYDKNSNLIEYGANLLETPQYDFLNYPETFDLVIARCEPENHIEEIISAYESGNKVKLVLVTNKNTKLFSKLKNRIIGCSNIIYNGPIYDKDELAFLKNNCRYYIHGHSVGGTNPSLLEALIAGCNILIHNNEFNSDVTAGHSFSWSNQFELQKLISQNLQRPTSVNSQKEYCITRFSWQIVADQHLELFESLQLDS